MLCVKLKLVTGNSMHNVWAEGSQTFEIGRAGKHKYVCCVPVEASTNLQDWAYEEGGEESE